MKCFIKNTPLIRNKLNFLSTQFKNVQITPTTISTKSCMIQVPPFTNATFCIPIKELLYLLEAKEFELDENIISYRINAYKNIPVYKKISVTKEKITPLVCGDYVKLQIDINLCKFIGKVSGYEICQFSTEKGSCSILWDDASTIKLSFKVNVEFEEFKIRCKDLWFLNGEYDSVILCICSNSVFFYLYGGESNMIIQVSYINK